MGSISLQKKGEYLTGHDGDVGFTYEDDNINGAVYGLFAKEDITKDDGTVVWKAGTKIDEKTTSKDGPVIFTRTGSDGKQTTNFYQGHYYVKELSIQTDIPLIKKNMKSISHGIRNQML